MSEMVKLMSGARVIYELGEGEVGKLTERGLIVCHPDRQPVIVSFDGVGIVIEPIDEALK